MPIPIATSTTVVGSGTTVTVSVGASAMSEYSELRITSECEESMSPSKRKSRVIMNVTLVAPAAIRSRTQLLTSSEISFSVPVAVIWPMMSAVVPTPVV